MRNKHPLYQEIVSLFQEKMECGSYMPGDKIESISQIVDRYGVSRVTANRVICELQKMNLVKTLQGRGSFVNALGAVPVKKVKVSSIQRLVLVSVRLRDSDRRFDSEIFRGINEAAKKHDLEFSEVINHQYKKQYNESFLPTLANSAFIMVSSPENIQLLYSMFSSNHARCVLLDNIFPGAESVLTDNADGIAQLVEHLSRLGHKRLLFAARFSSHQGTVNENERLEAFKIETKRRNLDGCTIVNGNYDELLGMVLNKKRPPTAVMFTQDDPALKFIKLLTDRGFRVPKDLSVTGFDDYSLNERGLERLTTFRLGYYDMGAEAVELLFQNERADSYMAPIWKRVKGTLIVRESSGKA